ncbi:DUF1801 domain-containing protein [Paenibacillus mendelii]|uniref:DUF1801 domain-containing protein n=1 Tax=Paenibacillus mendelii TaxID=206163 RepID=A0ABV6J6A2_9BACL|nr:DUF1801 domain-containing protein [Paenibacillus mendelii]
MNPEVTLLFENLNPHLQVQLCSQLRKMVHETIPGAEEKIQYKEQHFLKNGQFAAVISPSKDTIAFMFMNTEVWRFQKALRDRPKGSGSRFVTGISRIWGNCPAS